MTQRSSTSNATPRTRSYAPGLGRFLTKARLQEQLLGEHPYAYASNSPVTYVDPSGRFPQSIDHIYKCFLKGQEAQKKAEEQVAQFCKGFGLGVATYGDICNAMLHCLLMCYMTQMVDSTCAWEVGRMHEEDDAPWRGCPGYRDPKDGPNPVDQKCMDLYNNILGINCGKEASCYQCCLSHARNGDFQVVDYKRLHKSWVLPKTGCKKDPKNVKFPKLIR